MKIHSVKTEKETAEKKWRQDTADRRRWFSHMLAPYTQAVLKARRRCCTGEVRSASHFYSAAWIGLTNVAGRDIIVARPDQRGKALALTNWHSSAAGNSPSSSTINNQLKINKYQEGPK